MSRRRRPVDQRGRLELEPFGYVTTKSGQVRISYEGRMVTTVAGSDAQRLRQRLERADPAQVQLALAKATGHFKHGTERATRGIPSAD